MHPNVEWKRIALRLAMEKFLKDGIRKFNAFRESADP